MRENLKTVFIISILFGLAFLKPALVLSQEQDLQYLSTSKNWLNLVHYRKNIFGGYKSLIRGDNYFLAKDGANNPLAELKETLRQMQDPKLSQTVQCRYMARREMLLRLGYLYEDDLVKCKDWQEWLNNLKPDSVSLIFASADIESASSSFGHLLLKIHNSKNVKERELLDYGINFAARTGDTKGIAYAMKGLVGGFPANYGMAPYHHLIKEYTHLEGRDLWEYKLALSRPEIARLLMHLREINDVHFDYHFLDDNCSYMILKALEIARPSLVLTDDIRPWSIPIDALKAVNNSPDIVIESKRKKSQRTQWQNIRLQLDSYEKKHILEISENLKRENGDISFASSRELEALQYYYSQFAVTDENQKFRYKLNSERATRKDIVQWNEMDEVNNPLNQPTESHNSAMLSVGLGKVDKDDALFVRLRPGLQGWGEFDWGLAPGSELEVFNIEGIQKSNEGMKLKKLDLINFRVKKPMNFLEKSLSWSASLGWKDSIYSELQMGPSFNLGSRINWTESTVFRIQQIGEQTQALGLQSDLSYLIADKLDFFVRHRWLGRNSYGPSEEVNVVLAFRYQPNQEFSITDQQEKGEPAGFQRKQFVSYRYFF